jgi:hypothetical protein
LYALKVIDKRGRDVSTILNEQAALAKLSGSDFLSFHFVDAFTIPSSGTSSRYAPRFSDPPTAVISLMVEIGIHPWR